MTTVWTFTGRRVVATAIFHLLIAYEFGLLIQLASGARLSLTQLRICYAGGWPLVKLALLFFTG